MNPEAAASPEDPRVRRVELLISNLLRGGVIVSLIFIIGGTLMTFARHSGLISSPSLLHQMIRPGAVFPHTWRDVIAGLRGLQGQAFVILGLMVLIATPIMRVAISILAFIYQEDRVYTFITFLVLGLLLLSFALGKGE